MAANLLQRIEWRRIDRLPPRRAITSVNLVRKSFSLILRKTSRSEIGLVSAELQMESFFARRSIRVSFQDEGKVASANETLNNFTSRDQYDDGS